MANAISSLYSERNQIAFKVKADVFKSVALSHLCFIGVFFPFFTTKNINHISRQIDWRIKVCCFRQKFDLSIGRLTKDRISPTNLFISKVSLKNPKQI